MDNIMDNGLFKIATSLPVVLVTLYYLPVIGVILILFRCYVYRNMGNFNTATNLLSIGLILLVPKFMSIAIKKFNLPKVDILNKLMKNKIYENLVSYSEFLIILSIVAFVLPFIIRVVLKKMDESKKKQIQVIKEEQAMEEKAVEAPVETQEQAQGTYVVHCSQCGTNTIITSKSGTCPSCGNHIEYTE